MSNENATTSKDYLESARAALLKTSAALQQYARPAEPKLSGALVAPSLPKPAPHPDKYDELGF
ncbi:MAG: hypothetical protein WCD70_11200 [Alphaproteobacteria bacterium]